MCIDGNVYVVGGGYNGAPQFAASMECYDPIASEWRTPHAAEHHDEQRSRGGFALRSRLLATCQLAGAEPWAYEPELRPGRVRSI